MQEVAAADGIGTATISAGRVIMGGGNTMLLRNGDEYHSQFTLSGGILESRLASGNGSTISAATISLGAGGTLAFDLTGANASTTNLVLNGLSTVTGNVGTVDIRSFAGTGTFNLATRDIGAWNIPTLTTHGEAIAATRANGQMFLSASGNTLRFTNNAANGIVTWNTGNGTWDATSLNWDTTAIDGNTSKKFLHGDAVVFNAVPTTTQYITVQDAGVTVAPQGGNPGLQIVSGNWDFSGGSIIAVQGGKLSIGAATVNLHGENEFHGGIDITDGARIGLWNSKALGVYTGSTAGQVNVNGNASFWIDKEITNRFVVANNASLIIDKATANSTVKISGVHAGDQNGGAIFLGNGASLIISNAIEFSANSAAHGAAIFGQTVSLGAGAAFQNNSATGYGGAINVGYLFTVLSGANEFSGNKANYGGAISGYNQTISGGTNSFEGNKATQSGGAMFTGAGAVTVSGGTTSFVGNTAGQDGGAIYGHTVNLNGGEIGFQGNTATGLGGAIYATDHLSIVAGSGDITFKGNRDQTGANAFYFTGGAAKTLNLGAGTGRTLAFYDPFTIATANTPIAVNANVANTGTVLFSGQNGQHKTYSSTTVSYGTMALADKAVFGAGDYNFALQNGATLQADASGNSLQYGIFYFQPNSGLRFDMTGATTATTNLKLVSRNDFSGSAAGRGAVDLLNIGSLVLGSTYTLAESNYGNSFGIGTLYVDGNLYVGDRTSGVGLALQTADTGKKLQLLTADISGNTTLTWAVPDSGNWNTTDANWNGTINGIPVKQFVNGDSVIFDGLTTNSVTIRAEDAVKVAAMTVNGGNYHFISNIEASGKLTIGAATVNLYGANEFKGGIDITADGTPIGLWNSKALGTYAGSTAGQVNVNGNATFWIYGEITNRFVVVADKTLTFYNGATDGTIAITGCNAGNQNGGAISLGDGATLIVNSPIKFSENSATGYGGAIYGDISTITLGDHAVFSENSATDYGGAIYGRTYSTITLGSHAVFSGNSVEWDGGAVCGYYYSTITLGSHAAFSGNSASRYGGAIYGRDDSTITLGGNTLFENNLAGRSGGAIILWNSSVTLDTDIYDNDNKLVGSGAIAFTGNKANGAANSIYLYEHSALNLTGSGNIYFDDPIVDGGDGNSLTKNGTGFVQFVGNSTWNDIVDINEGTFRVVKDASFGAGNTARVVVKSGATLAGGGTIGAGEWGMSAAPFEISGTLSPDSDRFEIPDYDYDTHTFANEPGTVSPDKKIGTLTLVGATNLDGATLAIDLATGNVSDTISITGALTHGAISTVSIGSYVAGRFDILTATGGGINVSKFTLTTPTLTARQSAELSATGTVLTLTTTLGKNLTLTWLGTTDGNWDEATANWTNNPGGVATETRFLNGDTVVFDATRAGGANPRSISIQDTGVTQNGMTIESGDWNFSGGAIGGTGTLNKKGTGTVWLNAANTHTGGTNLYGGTLGLGNDQALGVAGGSWGGQLFVHGSGTLLYNADRTISNRITVMDGKALTIDDTETPSQLTITGCNVDGGGGGAISLGNGATLIVNSPIEFSNNSATGHGGAINGWNSTITLGDYAVFSGNSAKSHGGAICGWNSTTITLSDHAVFSGNSSGSDGGAIYGSKFTLTLGDYAVFSGNSANQYGGAIYGNGPTIALGDHAVFSGNSTKNNHGGAIYGTNSTITLGDHSVFSGNSAGQSGGAIDCLKSTLTLGSHALFSRNSAKDSGGAIFGELNATITLGGNTLFENNLARTNGGAIYLWNSSVTLDADGGAIAFTGNKANNAPNSIYLGGSSALNLTGSGNIYFDDPIVDGGSGNSLIKNGTGFVQFAGNSTWNDIVDINEGTFRVVKDASFGAGNTARVVVKSGATLAGGGTIGAGGRGMNTAPFEISGTLSPDSDRFAIPAYDYDTHTFANEPGTVSPDKKIGTLTLVGATNLDGATLAIDLAAGNVSDTISITGALTHGAISTVSIGSFVVGSFDILTASGGIDVSKFTLTTPTLTARQSAELSGTDTLLTLTTLDNLNITLTWLGTENGNWNTTAANWTNNPGAIATETRFLNDDTVHFNGQYSTKRDITVAVGGVTQKGMTIVSGDWNFGGGAIGGTGTLNKSGNGTVWLNAANTYTGGTNLFGGSLGLGNDQALGVHTGSGHAGRLYVYGTDSRILYDADRTLGNRVTVLANAGATFAGTDANAVLAFKNITSNGNGGAIEALSDSTLTFTGPTIFENITGAVNGGAIFAAANSDVALGRARK